MAYLMFSELSHVPQSVFYKQKKTLTQDRLFVYAYFVVSYFGNEIVWIDLMKPVTRNGHLPISSQRTEHCAFPAYISQAWEEGFAG